MLRTKINQKWVYTFNTGIQAIIHEKLKYSSNNDSSIDVKMLSSENCQKLDSSITVSSEWYNIRDDIMEDTLKAKLEQSSTVQQSLQALMHQTLVYIDNHKHYWSCGLDKKLVYLTNPRCFPGLSKVGQLWNKIANDYEW